ncbi:hypothetical protein BKA65DRAFT_40262 [Rhexocercosporidium sp. MPI-PUGE-AT-0058]|nr:hypothetical protein BKA65DRAFT_40262 [Rhexocercosporidium sp. MPI-PUGE-AT-0058]
MGSFSWLTSPVSNVLALQLCRPEKAIYTAIIAFRQPVADSAVSYLELQRAARGELAIESKQQLFSMPWSNHAGSSPANGNFPLTALSHSLTLPERHREIVSSLEWFIPPYRGGAIFNVQSH